MNLLLYTANDRTADKQVRISDERLQHLRAVLDTKAGDTLRVGEIGGLMGKATVLEISAEHALLDIALSEPPPPKIPLRIVLALPRPKMLRRILRMVAELGVAELDLINSYRVEKSYWQTPVLDPPTIDAYFLQGLSQARDTVLPSLTLHRRFKPFVEDVLPGLLENRRGLLAHPGDHPPCPGRQQQPGLLVIGPEGGFIPYEVEKLEAAGCDVVSLGPRILRVENAVSTLIARLSPD